MADRNLALDIAQQADSPEPGLVARVYVELACSFLKDGGAPTITADCHSLPEFEHEIARLKTECDHILREASARFRQVGGSVAEPVDREAGAGAQASAVSAPATGKTPVRLDKGLRVEDRMTRDVRTLRRNDKLSIADELMKVGKFRHVVVLEDDDDVAGVISQRDIFYGALAWSTGLGSAAHQKVLASVPVKTVMHTGVVTVEPDAPLADAAQIMLEKRIGCLPVVKDEHLVGILTEGDFLSLLTETAVEHA